MPKHLRERLEQVSKAAPRPMHLDLKDRLSALEAGIACEEPVPIMKQDLIGLLLKILGAKDPAERESLIARAKKILADATLLEDLKVPRVDLVHSPANMRTFLVTKSNEATGEADLELCELDDVAPDWWRG